VEASRLQAERRRRRAAGKIKRMRRRDFSIMAGAILWVITNHKSATNSGPTQYSGITAVWQLCPAAAVQKKYGAVIMFFKRATILKTDIFCRAFCFSC
jgi:hypothetical protein